MAVDAEQESMEAVIAAANYHVSVKDWPGISYHFFIGKKGEIFKTNWWKTVSYHVAGRNKECLGICLEGNFSIHPPTGSQLRALDDLLTYLQQGFPWTEITFHKKIALPEYPTKCPGDLFSYENY